MMIGILGILIEIGVTSDGLYQFKSFHHMLVLIGIPLGSLTLGIGLLKLNKSARLIAGILSLIWIALILTNLPFEGVFLVKTSMLPLFITILAIPLMLSAFFAFFLFGRKGVL